jgi:hypothetical protein
MKPSVAIVRVGNERYPTNVSVERAKKLTSPGPKGEPPRWELYRKPVERPAPAPISAPRPTPKSPAQDGDSFTTPTSKKS